MKSMQPLTNRKEILNEINNILDEDSHKDTDAISLFDVANLMKRYKYSYERIKNSYEKQFQQALNTMWRDSSIIVYDFDYVKKYLGIGFCRFFADWELNPYDSIEFAKKDGDLYVAENESIYYQEILAKIGNGLSELYDKFLMYFNYNTQYVYGIIPLNSNFFVNIDCKRVSIKDASYTFCLRFDSDEGKYRYECNSASLMNGLQGKEDEIFKSIFVKIDDCPEWSRQELYKIRQEQLAEEMKKEKRLELKRKIFPWVK